MDLATTMSLAPVRKLESAAAVHTNTKPPRQTGSLDIVSFTHLVHESVPHPVPLYIHISYIIFLIDLFCLMSKSMAIESYQPSLAKNRSKI